MSAALIMRQRRPRLENRPLLDLAHDAPCMLRLGLPGCGNNASVPCHPDDLEHGRAFGGKSHDYWAVPGCPVCHAGFTREKLGREGYKVAWMLAHSEYQDYLWRNKLIQVAR
jgi:hypothetical protein